MRAHGGGLLFALSALAVERVVQRLAEGVPQLLLVLAVERNGLRLGLPALLQGAHGVHTQLRRGAELFGFLDQRLAARGALLLRGFERGGGAVDGVLPLRLQLGKLLFRQVAGVAPAVAELMDLAVEGLPVGALALRGLGGAKGLDLVDQRQALGAVFGGFGAHLGQPGIDVLVRGVDGAVKALPQRVVGRAALVGGFPFFAQLANRLLQLAAAHGGHHFVVGSGRGAGGGSRSVLGRASLFGDGRRHVGFGVGGRGAGIIYGFSIVFGSSACLISAGSFVFCSDLSLLHRPGLFGDGGGLIGFGVCSFFNRRDAALALAAHQQRFSAGDELFAHLVGAPALPAFQLAGTHQRGVHARFERVVDQAAMGFERLAQRLGGAVRVLGVAGGDGLLQQHGAGFDRLLRGCALLGVDLRLGRLVGSGRSGGCFAARGADLVGPHGHGRQRRGGVLRGGHYLGQRGAKGIPHGGELALRGLELRRVAHVHAQPLRVGQQQAGVGAPLVNVGLQPGLLRLGVPPGLGGQQLDALRQQGGGFALHHHALLQILDFLDALDDLRAQAGQRLARQRRAGLGGVALPGQGVGDVQARRLQQRQRFRFPFGGHRLLALGAAQFVELFAQRLGGALVLGRKLLEHLLHLLRARVGGQPVAHALGALARRGGREHAARQRVERMGFGRLGRGGRLLGLRVLFVAGKGEHAVKVGSQRRTPPGVLKACIFAGIWVGAGGQRFSARSAPVRRAATTGRWPLAQRWRRWPVRWRATWRWRAARPETAARAAASCPPGSP